MIKLSMSPKIKSYWIDEQNYFSMQSFDKFVKYFFDFDFIHISDTTDTTDSHGVIHDIQDDVSGNISGNKLNIMLCVENCPANSWYKHYNKFNSYGNPNISIYLYGHIDRVVQTENHIAIPVIYLQLNYFIKFYTSIKPSIYTPFKDKDFCIVASRLDTAEKRQIYQTLKDIGCCRHISEFKKDIKQTSMYHSDELLNLFNRFKFVFVCENSIADGYITEKIFNCFLARSVPIYLGTNSVERYFLPSKFINASSPDFTTQILKIIDTPLLHMWYCSYPIVNKYSDDNYQTKLRSFCHKKIMS